MIFLGVLINFPRGFVCSIVFAIKRELIFSVNQKCNSHQVSISVLFLILGDVYGKLIYGEGMLGGVIF